ncbi:MAG: SH3 domain-containing protein [Chloroflexi bacterium]|nr:SH3 domain-containing protein [Chloroflexota bacterium]
MATATATAATVPPTATSTETAVPSPTITATATETAVPSATSTSPPIATATSTALPECIGASPTKLTVGGRARVINFQINVRSGPSTSNSVVNTLLPGREVQIVAGPECSSGQLWYHIISETVTNSSGEQIQVEGWSVEESGDTYFLEPID